MPTTTTRVLSMSTVLKTSSVGIHPGIRNGFTVTSPPLCESARGSESVNNGCNTTGGLAYNHVTRYITSYGDGTVVLSAS